MSQAHNNLVEPCRSDTKAGGGCGILVSYMSKDLGPLTKSLRQKRTLKTTSLALSFPWNPGLRDRYIRRFCGPQALQRHAIPQDVSAGALEEFSSPPSGRVYPVGFGEGLYDIMGSWHPQPTLRQKKEVPQRSSDLDLFRSMRVDDLWSDAQLVDVYRYLRTNKHLKLPDSWHDAMRDFDHELASMMAPVSG